MSILSGNKGEWSEVYTLLKLLADGHLHPGDANLSKIESIVYPIIRIIRQEASGAICYTLDAGDIIVTSNDKHIVSISKQLFVEQAQKLYTHKLKKLLVEIALGLQPNTPWSGYYDATGGYLIVKEDGDVICYHFYDINFLEDYLLDNTKLDTPSSRRHCFGEVTEDNLMKLNLQIRFV